MEGRYGNEANKKSLYIMWENSEKDENGEIAKKIPRRRIKNE